MIDDKKYVGSWLKFLLSVEKGGGWMGIEQWIFSKSTRPSETDE